MTSKSPPWYSDDDFFETFALHGFRQLASRAAAIVALEQESARIIGTLTTLDVVDMMLDTMLEGWHFGVRESRMQVAGFVPSIKKEGAITMYDESDLQERRPFRTQALRQQHKIRSRLLDRTKPIQTEVCVYVCAVVFLGLTPTCLIHTTIIVGV